MNPDNRQDLLLTGFISVSLLLHLIFIYLTPHPETRIPQREEPVYVELVPEKKPAPTPPPQVRELDAQEVPELQKPREKPAKRLAAVDQVVEKEQAPKGTAEEDQRPDAPAKETKTLQRRTYVAPPTTAAATPTEHTTAEAPMASPERDQRPQQEVSETAPVSVPDLKSLLQLPETTRSRLESDWKQKYRKDVEEGNAVWLDTESDLLFSFFTRFRNNIYAVWNYPGAAARRGEEGACLLQIQINRDGSVRSVNLLESSGFDVLDKEAMGAVRRGASYGPLPRSYTEPKLTIMAVFKYNLSMSAVRGGTIY